MKRSLKAGIEIILDKAHLKQFWNSTQIGLNTYRIWTQAGEYRVCLHYVDKDNMVDANMHTHAWPASFLVVQGKYYVNIGNYTDTQSDILTNVRGMQLSSGSAYEMKYPLEAHQAFPLEDSYAIMVNKPKFQDFERHKGSFHKVSSPPPSLSRDELGRRIDNFVDIIMRNRETSLKGWL